MLLEVCFVMMYKELNIKSGGEKKLNKLKRFAIAGAASAILLGGMAVTAAPALADSLFDLPPVQEVCIYTYHADLHGAAFPNDPLDGSCRPFFSD